MHQGLTLHNNNNNDNNSNNNNNTYSLLNDKNTLKIFGPRTWCTKKSFGYRVAHHGYLLTSCPGQYIIMIIVKNFNNSSTNDNNYRTLTISVTRNLIKGTNMKLINVFCPNKIINSSEVLRSSKAKNNESNSRTYRK